MCIRDREEIVKIWKEEAEREIVESRKRYSEAKEKIQKDLDVQMTQLYSDWKRREWDKRQRMKEKEKEREQARENEQLKKEEKEEKERENAKEKYTDIFQEGNAEVLQDTLVDVDSE